MPRSGGGSKLRFEDDLSFVLPILNILVGTLDLRQREGGIDGDFDFLAEEEVREVCRPRLDEFGVGLHGVSMVVTDDGLVFEDQ